LGKKVKNKGGDHGSMALVLVEKVAGDSTDDKTIGGTKMSRRGKDKGIYFVPRPVSFNKDNEAKDGKK